MNNQQLSIKDKVDTVRAALELMKPQLALALPTHLTPERLLRVAMTAIQNTPRLLDCDRTSLFAAIMTCAQLGLEPDGVLGQAYLVPFGNKVQFIPGYKGYLQLARNSGEISTIQAHEVRANDFFEYAYGINEKLEHRPADGERGAIKYFYAYALYKDGGHIFEVMSRADVDAIRDKSEGYRAFKNKKIKSNPWDSNYVQMGRKTAIRRLANYLPLNVQRAAALDAAAAAGKFASTDDYGEVIIDAQASEVESQAALEQKGATGATEKLDKLAGGMGGSGSDDVQPCNETAARTAEPDKGEMVGDPPDLGNKPPNMTQLKKAIKAANSSDEVNLQLDLSRHLSPDHREKVSAAAAKRMDEFTAPAIHSNMDESAISKKLGEHEHADPTPDDGGLFGDD